MANLVTGTCNCGRHSGTIPKATEMHLCRTSVPYSNGSPSLTNIIPNCIDCRKWAGAMFVTAASSWISSIVLASFRGCSDKPPKSELWTSSTSLQVTMRHETNPRIITGDAEVLLDSFLLGRASKQSIFTTIVASHVVTTHVIRYFKYSAREQNS